MAREGTCVKSKTALLLSVSLSRCVYVICQSTFPRLKSGISYKKAPEPCSLAHVLRSNPQYGVAFAAYECLQKKLSDGV